MRNVTTHRRELGECRSFCIGLGNEAINWCYQTFFSFSNWIIRVNNNPILIRWTRNQNKSRKSNVEFEMAQAQLSLKESQIESYQVFVCLKARKHIMFIQFDCLRPFICWYIIFTLSQCHCSLLFTFSFWFWKFVEYNNEHLSSSLNFHVNWDTFWQCHFLVVYRGHTKFDFMALSILNLVSLCFEMARTQIYYSIISRATPMVAARFFFLQAIQAAGRNSFIHWIVEKRNCASSTHWKVKIIKSHLI